jgi:hypothetical protein
MTAVSNANSAAQPENKKYQPLAELTTRSARIGKWQLSLFHPWEDTYEYEWGGEKKKGTCFKCLLIDVDQPTSYCHAEFKKTKKNENAYHAAVKKYAEGGTFVFEKVGFVDSIKAAYLAAPKREVINLATTSANKVLGGAASSTSAVQPCPEGSVADKMELQQNQHFDLTALVKTVSPLRPAKGRAAFDVCLIDGSTDLSTGKMRTMKTTLFGEEQSANQNHAFAEKCIENKVPITFLLLQGNKEDDKFTFSSARKGCRMVEAMASEKMRRLTDNAVAWLADANTQAFEQKEFVARDYSADEGLETTCKLFAMLSHHESGIAALDEEETIWNINWLRVYEPAAGENILTSDGQRIWFQLTFRDSTHHHTLFITEKAALQLSGFDNTASFMAAHQAGSLWFPLVSSLKILRKRSPVKPGTAVESSAGQPAYTHEFDSRIVEATPQVLTEVPTIASLPLIEMLAADTDAVDVFVPACLYMIQKSVHYSLIVKYARQDLVGDLSTKNETEPTQNASLARPCSQAFALVEATAAGKMEQLGVDGFKLTTTVKDVLAPRISAKFTLTAFCTLANLQDFKLDPPRGTHKQTALVVISNVRSSGRADEPVNFIVDSIMLLPRDDVTKIAASMKKLLYYTAAATQLNTRKRTRAWDETFSPAKALKCRTLSRHPTGSALPDYKAV